MDGWMDMWMDGWMYELFSVCWMVNLADLFCPFLVHFSKNCRKYISYTLGIHSQFLWSVFRAAAGSTETHHSPHSIYIECELRRNYEPTSHL